MDPEILSWMDVTLLLNERRDEIRALTDKEQDGAERLRLEGARRELDWLIEQVQEKWGWWASRGA